jgi:hypothetical protein
MLPEPQCSADPRRRAPPEIDRVEPLAREDEVRAPASRRRGWRDHQADLGNHTLANANAIDSFDPGEGLEAGVGGGNRASLRLHKSRISPKGTAARPVVRGTAGGLRGHVAASGQECCLM